MSKPYKAKQNLSNMKKCLIKCDNCGIVSNTSQVTCDVCGAYISEIKLGDSWYSVDELDEDNMYA